MSAEMSAEMGEIVNPINALAPSEGASKKVFIKTFGCQMNEYDSDKMVDVLHAADDYMTI
jgi:Uncharacterized protein family UPF0004